LNIEDFEIFLEDFCEFLNGLEESITKMKQQIAKLVGVELEKAKKVAESQDVKAKLQEAKADVKADVKTGSSWNPDKIKWLKVQGAKGEFEKSEDINNPEFKAMLRDLANHNGRLTRDGYFYWTFKNGATVGRKKR